MGTNANRDQTLRIDPPTSQPTALFEANSDFWSSGTVGGAMLCDIDARLATDRLLACLLADSPMQQRADECSSTLCLNTIANVAHETYRAWRRRHGEDPSGMSINDLDEHAARIRAMLLLRTIIASLNAETDAYDRSQRFSRKKLADLNLPSETLAALQAEWDHPEDSDELAAQVDSMAAACEAYLIASLVVDQSNPQGVDCLADLAAALRLPIDLLYHLEEQAFDS